MTRTPDHRHLAALLAAVQLGLRDTIAEHLAGQPRAQAYDSDKTTGGGGSDPTATAATTPDRARHDLEVHDAAVDRAYRALLTLAALSERYLPAHQPRRSTIAAETRGCTLHQRAGVENHRQAYRTTDYADVMDTPLKDPIPVCRWCWDFPRRTHPDGDQLGRLPTPEEIITYERTGKLRLKGRTKKHTWTAGNIAGDWAKAIKLGADMTGVDDPA